MRWRRGSNEHHRSAPLRPHSLADHHREGDQRVRAQPGDVPGRAQRDQAADQGSGREAVRRQGEERQHAGAQGQAQGLPRTARRAVGRQEGDRDPRGGSPHRCDHGTLRQGSTMALKNYKPTTPGQRQLVLVDRSGLYKGKPLKALTVGKTSTGGRNNLGRITSRFRGGGHKKALRTIDFRRAKHDVPATVERIEYDPNRTGFIALIKYKDGELAYILAPQRLAVGDTIVAGDHVDVKPGNAMPVGNIPVGTIVHNVEMKIGKGGQLARSAGTYAQIVGRDQEYVILRLNSSEQRLVHGRCMATVGAVSNPDHMNISIGKAGRKRWMGRMPHNRGMTMNPVDHPHGGRTKGGGHPVTPWGFPTKGKKTRKNKSTAKFIIASRHARKKTQ